VFVLAAGAVGASAGAEFELAGDPVAEELVPFAVGGFAVFLGGPGRAAAGDERTVVVDDVGVVAT
jgi:hypothetical protein